jgi:hypothetical protein
LSGDPLYSDCLVGRHLCEYDRSPAYTRIKEAFVRQLCLELGKKAVLPQPAWAHGADVRGPDRQITTDGVILPQG